MDAAAADCQAIKDMSDVQMEEKWGETGWGGDAAGVPLKTLADFGIERAYLELGVGPAHQYIFVKKWVYLRQEMGNRKKNPVARAGSGRGSGAAEAPERHSWEVRLAEYRADTATRGF
jgi:hypothetical protein